jgi:probable HAF family extracellular repeat protein
VGISGGGTIAGMMAAADGSFVPYVWSQGLVTQIPKPQDGDGARAFGVNDIGQVVGKVNFDDWIAPEAAVWTGTQWANLGTLGGDSAYASLVNNAGHIVGRSRKYWFNHIHGFITDGHRMTDLRTLGGRESHPLGLNNLDVVVGQSSDSKFNVRGFVWTAGRMLQLDRLVADAPDDLRILAGNSVNDAGAIVGKATFGGASHAVLLTPVEK